MPLNPASSQYVQSHSSVLARTEDRRAPCEPQPIESTTTRLVEPVGASLPGPVRWLWLTAPVAVLALSVLLRPGPDRSLLLPWSTIALPDACTSYRLLGVDCPGCGLTRSFVHLSRGNLAAAWQLNPVGIALYVLVIAQIPLATVQCLPQRIRNAWRRRPFYSRWFGANMWIALGMMVALAMQWVLRMTWSW
ncbi:MAG: DUF2752 domain-containing protein [Pirellulaceae bacterium]|nr:DUF2752 domain-containing protein [Pirellulaceae bacterium]